MYYTYVDRKEGSIMPDYVYAIIGLGSIFLGTTLGSALVFFFRKKQINPKLNQIFIGFASGVMIAASVFSLLLPAMEQEIDYMPSWIVIALATALGALFMWGIDKVVPHFHTNENKEEGPKTKKLSKNTKMFLAVLIHNVPEGLSVGIALGVALANPGNDGLMFGALALAIGLTIQNIPEGAVVSLPIKGETNNSKKAFLFGTLTGIVEPIAGVIGLLLAMNIQFIMPWALAFSAGCMIYVVVEEMIPDLKNNSTSHFGVWSFIVGFIIMMVLDTL